MNRDTGELYKTLEEGQKDIAEQFLKQAMTPQTSLKDTLAEKLIPLNQNEYQYLKGKTRAERRRWARENKRR